MNGEWRAALLDHIRDRRRAFVCVFSTNSVVGGWFCITTCLDKSGVGGSSRCRVVDV